MSIIGKVNEKNSCGFLPLITEVFYLVTYKHNFQTLEKKLFYKFKIVNYIIGRIGQ